MEFSLYIHIPWCESKCPYCDFNSHAAAAWPEADYVGALISEFERRAASPPWIGEPISTIFFGGGTPSLFEPESIGAMIEAANRRLRNRARRGNYARGQSGYGRFRRSSWVSSGGVNRISFGAQSFEPAILKFLGRIHNADQTREAAMMAHRAGFERLNLDLIFAVPGQTLETCGAISRAAAALEPDHISAYNLTFEEGTPFFTEMKRGRIMPCDDEQAAMYRAVREELPRRGYRCTKSRTTRRPATRRGTISRTGAARAISAWARGRTALRARSWRDGDGGTRGCRRDTARHSSGRVRRPARSRLTRLRRG